MHQQLKSLGSLHSLLFTLLLLFISVELELAAGHDVNAKENPFTPKAYLMRYWDKTIHNSLPKSPFLLSKASPLDAVDSSRFAKLAEQGTLSTALPSFCSSANLFCFPDLSPSSKHETDSDFAVYNNKNFTNYGSGKVGGVDSFKNYSDGEPVPNLSFHRYSGESTSHNDKFNSYSSQGQSINQRFDKYGSSATGGAGDFSTYNPDNNDLGLSQFATYSNQGNRRAQSFSTYSNKGNAGKESFSSYGNNGEGARNEFKAYLHDTNAMETHFKSYSEAAHGGANDTFKSYGADGAFPIEFFKSYGNGGNAGVESFKEYNLNTFIASDYFKTYAENSKASQKVNFAAYGASISARPHDFTRYGQNAKGHQNQIDFKTYGSAYTKFKDYAKSGVTFANYTEGTPVPNPSSGSSVNRWVEPGKFFRESMLKNGTLMPMPDIRDRMPRRSFLPRSIVSNLPFTSSKLNQLKEIFHASDNSTMESIIKDALSDCERAPSKGETKRCVGSAEDMIDFATSVLGNNVALHTTENAKGSKQDIMIGTVKGINGGEVTKSVSCHQSLYPYLLYYCHSVPEVRVYEADILESKTMAKINHGVAICHLDTSAWSATHGAFLTLGSSPGRIEVCHWIFENDLTWTIADIRG